VLTSQAKLAAKGQEGESEPLPPQVEALVGREQEIARIVFGRGASTAKDVQARLSADISNAAVRSMLMRLVAKGVLQLERGHRGPGQPSIYVPTSTSHEVKRRALRQLCDRYFEGSLLNLVVAALNVLQEREAGDGSNGAYRPDSQVGRYIARDLQATS
jgi:predicted transcriptional regulator